MDCCSQTLDLGCVDFCGTISTGVLAPATDTYIISLVGAGGYASFDFTIGEEIVFENPFNEDSVSVFQILRNGEPVMSGIYDCFQVKVTAGIDLTTASTSEEENTVRVFYNGILIDTINTTDSIITVNIFP